MVRASVLLATVVAATTLAAAPAGASTAIDPETEVSCGYKFKYGVLSGPRTAERSRTQVAKMLRAMIRSKDPLPMPRTRWLVLSDKTSRGVRYITFASGRLLGLTAVTFGRKPGGRWKYNNSSHYFDCDLNSVLPNGREATPWAAVPTAIPTDPSSRVVRVSVQYDACTGGRSVEDRVRVAGIGYDAQSIRIQLDVLPDYGFNTCPGSPPTYFDVQLDEPIGNRALVDSAKVPDRSRLSISQLEAIRGGADPVEQLVFNRPDAEFCSEYPILDGSKMTRSQQKRFFERAIKCGRAARVYPFY